MKKTIICLLLITASFISEAQSPPPDPAILMLKKFYTAYMSEFSATYNLIFIERNLISLRRKYCTPNCLRQYEKLGNETDADPLIKAQDSGTAFLKHLTVHKSPGKANLYTVTYSDPYSRQKISIILTVINQNGVFKIASINR